MPSVPQPEYTIWLREVTAAPLNSYRDPTQVRRNDYRPIDVTGKWDINTPEGIKNKPLQSGDVSGAGNPNLERAGSTLSRGFIYVGLVTNYEKLEFTTKYNDVGGWTLLMQDNTTEANILKNMCYGRQNPQNFLPAGFDGITVKRNGKIILSGPVKGFEATGDFYSEHGPMIQFWGTDDTNLLAERIVCPRALTSFERVPLNNNPPYSGNLYTGLPTNDSYAFGEYILPTANARLGGQGFGWYNYPESTNPGDPNSQRRVGAVLRELVINQVGTYAPYQNVYPYRDIRGPWVPPKVDPIYPYPQVEYINQRRVPFLFLGSTNDPNYVYVNERNSNQQNTDTELVNNSIVSSVPNYRVSARYKQLLKVMQEVAAFAIDLNNPTRYRGYQFAIIQDENILVPEVIYNPVNKVALREELVSINGLRFMYRQPNFTEDTIIFSEKLGNISSYKYNYTSPKGTIGVVGGQGEGLLRFFFQQSSQELEKFGHKEFFKDRRDIQYGDKGGANPPQPNKPNTLPFPTVPVATPAQLENYNAMRTALLDGLDKELVELGPKQELEIETLNISPTVYNENYGIGDFVTVVLDSAEIKGQITQVNVSITKDEGEVVKATIGNQTFGGDSSILFDSIRRNTYELEVLEGYP